MSNSKTEKAGIQAVTLYEQSQGRQVILGSGGKGFGFDIETIDSLNNETRKIEVKATKKGFLESRWLEPLEQLALHKYDDFWLYLVVNTLDTPQIFTYSKSVLQAKYSGELVKHLYNFSRREFKNK